MLHEIKLRLLTGKHISKNWLKRSFALSDQEAEHVREMIYQSLPKKKLEWDLGKTKK